MLRTDSEYLVVFTCCVVSIVLGGVRLVGAQRTISFVTMTILVVVVSVKLALVLATFNIARTYFTHVITIEHSLSHMLVGCEFV